MIHARPVVVASQCLGFAAVRYNGAIIHDEFVQRLTQYVEIVDVCPEVRIGLGVPRDPIRMQRQGDAVALVQPATARDITADMHAFAAAFLDPMLNADGSASIDGFILKSRSPSCGIADVSVFADDGGDVAATAPGMFAGGVLRRFPELAVTDEILLRDPAARTHFLTRIFTSARFRAAADTSAGGGKRRDLVAFHSVHKYMLMAFHPAHMTALGQIVANADLRDDAAFAMYGEKLAALMTAPAQTGGLVNALSHMLGYISNTLSAARRADMAALIHADPATALPQLRNIVTETGNAYLQAQVCFEPFPAALQ